MLKTVGLTVSFRMTVAELTFAAPSSNKIPCQIKLGKSKYFCQNKILEYDTYLRKDTWNCVN